MATLDSINNDQSMPVKPADNVIIPAATIVNQAPGPTPAPAMIENPLNAIGAPAPQAQIVSTSQAQAPMNVPAVAVIGFLIWKFFR